MLFRSRCVTELVAAGYSSASVIGSVSARSNALEPITIELESAEVKQVSDKRDAPSYAMAD